jgi:anti-sigma factor RsiW
MNNNDKNETLLRLNALVDGELAPAARARIAAEIAADRELARTHATLAKLKASVIESGDAQSGPDIRIPPRSLPRRVAAWGVGIAASVGLLFAVARSDLFAPAPVALTSEQVAVTLAALPVKPVVPDLVSGGLTLVKIEFGDRRDMRHLVATYAGPRGCRLEFHVRPHDAAPPQVGGTSRHAWRDGDFAYELVAFGMPGERFRIVAEAAERQTRGRGHPDQAEHRLREARLAAPPCTG